MLHGPASNTVGFLLRHTWVSSTYLKWPIGKKMNLSPIENSVLQELFVLKTKSIFTRKQGG
jgi:hypothetical protein